jgi:hypothetical protein
MMMKQGGMLYPVIDEDKQLLRRAPARQAFRVEILRGSARSVEYHRRYWALINTALDYWEPDHGLVGPNEIRFLERYNEFLVDKAGVDPETMDSAQTAYLEHVYQERRQKWPAREKRGQDLHEWVKLQVGHFDWIQTPTGMIRKTKSTNFNAMDQERFIQYYSTVFDCLWRMVCQTVEMEPRDLQEAAEARLLGFD